MGQLINSVSEFEAVLAQVIIRVDKYLYEQHRDPVVQNIRRTLQKILEVSKESDKLKAQRDALSAAGETLRERVRDDEQLHDHLWDLLDYVEYRA